MTKYLDRRELIASLGLFIFFTLIGLAIAEIILRNFSNIKPMGRIGTPQYLFVSDAINGYRIADNFSGTLFIEGGSSNINTGSLGNRCSGQICNLNNIDVATFGDSYTFGWGLNDDETWPSRLGIKSGLNVINFGQPGYNLAQYRNLIEFLDGKGILPDKIIIGISENDFLDGSATQGKKVINGWLVKSSTDKYLIYLRSNPIIYFTSLGTLLIRAIDNMTAIDQTYSDQLLKTQSLIALEELFSLKALSKRDVYVLYENSASHIKYLSTKRDRSALNYQSYYDGFLKIVEKNKYFKLIDSTDTLANYYQNKPFHSSLFIDNDQHYNNLANDIIASLLFKVIEKIPPTNNINYANE